MFTITRRRIHQFRIVARKTLNIHRGTGPPIAVESADDGLLLRVRSPEAAVELRIPGDNQGEHICAPFEILDTCQGKNDSLVTLTLQDGKVVAQWNDGSVPQLVQYDQPEPPEQVNIMPSDTSANSSELLRTLEQACTVTDPEPTRYALSCVQLDGDRGRISATDGHQILTQTGFSFPWDGSVLLPASTLFGCPHLPHDAQVGVGLSKDWLTLTTGSWTFHFRLNVDGRFPRIDDCIPRKSVAITTLDISDIDAAFLADNIKQLPSPDDLTRPITLDLNGEVVVRARSDAGQAVTELALLGSVTSGEALRVNTNRTFLARALALGFRQIHFGAADQPAFCRDDNRAYVWALLSGDDAIRQTENSHRIESPRSSAVRASAGAKRTRSRIPTMSATKTNTNGNGHKSNAQASASEVESGSSIEHAEALRDALKDALDRTRHLIRSLKAQRKASRIVESTLASLRQLQSVDL